MQRVKTIVGYDPSNGELFDPNNGASLGCYWMGLAPMPDQPAAEARPDVERLAKLKAAGFTAAEIVEMSKAGLL